MTYLNLLRVNQWLKNLLLFAPIFLANDFNLNDFKNLIIIFFSFSFACSSVYIFNDLIDINDDKLHPTKKNRPIASGKISKKESKIVGTFLILISLIILIFNENYQLFYFYFFYIFSNYLYTLYLKKKFLVDIIFLVSFYIVRILIGSNVTDNSVSYWLLICSVFFFGSLAFLKRGNDVLKYSNISNFKRSYSITDFNFLRNFFIIFGSLCIITFIFYINSDDSVIIYDNFRILYLIPLILIIFFILLLKQLNRRKILDDPTMHIVKDKSILLLLFIILIIYFLAL